MTKNHRQSPAALLAVGQGPQQREALKPWAPGGREASCRHAQPTPAPERGAATMGAAHVVRQSWGMQTKQWD